MTISIPRSGRLLAAAFTAILAAGTFSGAGEAQAGPRLPLGHPFMVDEADVTHVQYRRGWDDDFYYERRRGYGNAYGRRYREPRFYSKEEAKDYWRAQKEAQKRAIKRGYYNSVPTGRSYVVPGQNSYGR